MAVDVSASAQCDQLLNARRDLHDLYMCADRLAWMIEKWNNGTRNRAFKECGATGDFANVTAGRVTTRITPRHTDKQRRGSLSRGSKTRSEPTCKLDVGAVAIGLMEGDRFNGVKRTGTAPSGD